MKTIIYTYLAFTLNILLISEKGIDLKKHNALKKNFKKQINCVDLLNFCAIKNGNLVNVYWDIKSAGNYSFFTLERSKDGVIFEKVVKIEAANNTNNVLNYIETDYTPLLGTSYYRLKLTTINKKNNFSSMVKINQCRNKIKKSMDSNPVDNNLMIDIGKLNNCEALVVLRAIDGKEYFSKVLIQYKNLEITGIDLENKLNPGTYIITAVSNNFLYNQNLIIKE